MLHPAALPCILPDENGEEQLSRASPRLAPTKVKQENKKSVHPSNLELKSTTNMRAILSGKRQSRKKTNVACTNCVRAKAGCDQGRPCSRCTRLGKPNCVDRPINSRRRRKIPRRFADEILESSFQDSTDVFKPKANEFIIGSYNGDVDGYIDYYMAQVPAPLSQAGYNPMRSYGDTTSAIPPPPLPPKLPPIPSLNAMAPRHHSPRTGMIYYGQTNWAMCPNPMLGSIPMTAPALRDDLPNTGSLFATGDIRDQDLSHSSALSAMDMSKPSHTPVPTLAEMAGLLTEANMKHEPMRPSTTSPFAFRAIQMETEEYVAS